MFNLNINKNISKKRFCIKNIVFCKKFFYGVVGLITLVVVFSAIQTSTLGAKLQYLEDREIKLGDETILLEGELAKADSLSKISEMANDHKFFAPQKIVYSQNTEEVGMNLR